MSGVDGMVVGKDLPVTREELVSLRRSVGWNSEGDYDQILREFLFHISARLEGRLVGFLSVAGSRHGDLLIHSLCVHPDFQRKGLGRLLMEEALEACRGLDPQGVNVLFEEENLPFFEKFGFQIIRGGYMSAQSLKARSARS